MLPRKGYGWDGGQDDKIPIWLDGGSAPAPAPLLCSRKEFEWSVEADGAIALRLSELCFFIFHEYALVDLKSSDPRAHGGIATWRKFRPLETIPDFVTADDDDRQPHWYFTRVGALAFLVHFYDPHGADDEGIKDAGSISAPKSRRWRRLRLYACAIGHFLRDLPRATEKVLRPDGAEARVCAKRFKAMAGLTSF